MALGAASALANPNGAAAAAPDNIATENRSMSQSLTAEQALARYEAAVRVERERVLSSELAKDQRVREQGLYFIQSIQTTAFNMYMAPRAQYPAFYVHPVFMPFELSWGLPSPSFLYRFAFLDGRHTYRVYGNSKGNFWTNFQVLRGFWGDEDKSSLTVLDFDELPKAPNGDYEIFLGPNPPADAKGQTWIKVDPVETITLNVRDVTYDWRSMAPVSMKIEILDRDPDASLHIDEADFAKRLEKAMRWVRHNVNFALGFSKAALTGEHAKPAEPGEAIDPALVRDRSRRNRFSELYPPGRSANAGNPLACFAKMLYDLKADEALIIEVPPFKARFWDLQLGDVWGQTTDYSFHRSSINGHEARLDRDGMFRAVLAATDPGVANWLDYAHVPMGVALFRRYKADKCHVPTAKLVKLSEVARHLPPDTARITPDQRRAEMEIRRRASLARYGY